MKWSMSRQEKCDLLIQVTALTGMTVYCLYMYIYSQLGNKYIGKKQVYSLYLPVSYSRPQGLHPSFQSLPFDESYL